MGQRKPIEHGNQQSEQHIKPYYPNDDEIDTDYENEPNEPQSKIIARMPSLDEHPKQIRSRLETPSLSYWNRSFSLKISDRQQNRILWCVVAVLLCIITCNFFGANKTNQVSNEPAKTGDETHIADSFRHEKSSELAVPTSFDFNQTNRDDLQSDRRFANDASDNMIMPRTIIDMDDIETVDYDFTNAEHSNRNSDTQSDRNIVRSAWNRNTNTETDDNSIIWNSQAAYAENQDYEGSDYSAFASDQFNMTAASTDEYRQQSNPYSNQPVGQYQYTNNRQPVNQYSGNYETRGTFDQQRYVQPNPEPNQYSVQSTPYSPNVGNYRDNSVDPRFAQPASHYAADHSMPYQNRVTNGQNMYANQGAAYSQPNNVRTQTSLSEYSSTNYRESIPQTPSQPNTQYYGTNNGAGQGYVPQTQPYSTASQPIDPRFVQ